MDEGGQEVPGGGRGRTKLKEGVFFGPLTGQALSENGRMSMLAMEMKIFYVVLASLGVTWMTAFAGVTVDFEGYEVSSSIEVVQDKEPLRVRWPVGEGREGEVEFSLTDGAGLICSVGLESGEGAGVTVLEDARVDFRLGVGEGNQEKNGWTVFFDEVDERIDLRGTRAFGKTTIRSAVDLSKRKWVRFESGRGSKGVVRSLGCSGDWGFYATGLD